MVVSFIVNYFVLQGEIDDLELKNEVLEEQGKFCEVD